MRLRQLGVAKKFGVLSDNFKGKRVVIIDDSIVRGNTISPIIKLLRESGAKEVSLFLVSKKKKTLTVFSQYSTDVNTRLMEGLVFFN